MKYTKQEILRIVEEEDVEFIRLQFTDIFGMLKNIAVTAAKLEKALDNRCMFDGTLIDGFDSVEASELYLHPDLDTFAIFPWRPQQGKVARMLCDIYTADGKPFAADSRQILKRVVKEAEDAGYTFIVGPELEFFLFHRDEVGAPTLLTHEKAGYFDLSPLDLGENARRDMVLTLEAMGFEVEGSHHEVAPAQHEIDFKHAEALETADNIMTFKLAVKSVAARHGLHASFMPKPKMGQCGSGLHLKTALFRDGKNIFADETDGKGLSREAYQFIAGLLVHIKGMTLVANPIVNSYKRFVPGYEAPMFTAWSTKNRSPLIRVASARGEGPRVELRSPDPSANPYLVLAVCLAAGLDGIRRKLTPPEEVTGDVMAMSKEKRQALGLESLPGNMHEAIRAMEKDDLIRKTLGAPLFEQYVAVKRKEWNEYRSQVTNWEIDRYLNRI